MTDSLPRTHAATLASADANRKRRNDKRVHGLEPPLTDEQRARLAEIVADAPPLPPEILTRLRSLLPPLAS